MRLIWGREIMRWAKKNNGLNDNQYGGRKGAQALTAALNNTLTCDVIRYYGEEASLIDNDTQTCYGRIVPVLLAYTLLRMGMHINLIKFQCTWLNEDFYHLKLCSKMSKDSYTSTENNIIWNWTGDRLVPA